MTEKKALVIEFPKKFISSFKKVINKIEKESNHLSEYRVKLGKGIIEEFKKIENKVLDDYINYICDDG